jgi:hypothetical protein
MLKRFLNKLTTQIIFSLLIGLLTFGCATPPGVVSIQTDQNPLRMLQYVAVESLPTGKRQISDNGRVFYSNYFIPKGSPKFWTPANKKSKSRFFTVITILGNERPYTIEFSVIKENSEGNEGAFKEIGRSVEAAKLMAKYYKENLEKSLKDRNFVDDFRVF